MKEVGRTWDSSQLRKYDIQLDPLPRLEFGDPQIEEMIAAEKPVIITNSNLVGSALKWDLPYLSEHMDKTTCTVIMSKNHNFKYFDDKSVPPSMKAKFVPPTRRASMKMADFYKRMKRWKEGDERLYLQQTLNSTVGEQIVIDFLKFRWEWLNQIQRQLNWGPLTSNLLLIAMEGNVTPCHYDEQENLFSQVHGHKRILLFPPEQFECFYPYPVFHPHDRQSQVDFENPDLTRFPRFSEARGLEAVVSPGDVIYIPAYWWHQVESLMNGSYTVSINFWYKKVSSSKVIRYPLKGHQKVAIMRNIEKMLCDALNDPDEVGPLLRAVTLGRYE